MAELRWSEQPSRSPFRSAYHVAEGRERADVDAVGRLTLKRSVRFEELSVAFSSFTALMTIRPGVLTSQAQTAEPGIIHCDVYADTKRGER